MEAKTRGPEVGVADLGESGQASYVLWGLPIAGQGPGRMDASFIYDWPLTDRSFRYGRHKPVPNRGWRAPLIPLFSRGRYPYTTRWGEGVRVKNW